MKKHKYWGAVEEDWAGYSGDVMFSSDIFEVKDITVFLGAEFDDEGEFIEVSPTDEELNNFEKTYQNFMDNLDSIVEDIKVKTFEHYLNIYAHYYENEEKSGEKPLNINSKDKHFENIKDILHMRVLKEGNIQIVIRYKIDTEHGIEIRLANNKIIAIGGIAET